MPSICSAARNRTTSADRSSSAVAASSSEGGQTHAISFILDDGGTGRFSRPVSQIPRQGSGAACRKMARSEAGRSLGLAGAGRDGRLAAEHPGSLWRPRCQLRLRSGRDRGSRNRGAGSDDRILGAQRHRGALHPELRVRGTETALAAENGKRRVRRRHRHDRTRHRLRSAGRADHGAKSRATTTSSTARRPSSPTARPPT